jgi:ATP-dependent RNA helicase SUPV3L1/SUV3
MLRRALPPSVRSRGVTAVLGPTNTGKTHLALERMAAHATGMIGLPLRLLAREVYGRMVEKVGVQSVALITGEEKIKPDRPRFWVSTIEAMPRDLTVDFVAIDEVQLASDLDRGHVFTDRLLNQRGREETMLIGAGTIAPLLRELVPGINIATRPRLSQLTFAGEKKLTRLPPRSAIVAFSAEEVYAIAELVRRQKGGAAVVLGALSPRTRNAQVELYQSGEVDYLIATDAIGMGLNLDVDHVAFASDRKFDGQRFRKLYPAELAQIAGRAGRHLRDGTFGSTGRCPAFDPELVQAIEDHRFEPIRQVQWRNPDLDFASVARLQASLAQWPSEKGLTKAPMADDEIALDILSRDLDIVSLATGRTQVERLWEACQLPDYRKIAPSQHAELVATVYHDLMTKGRLPVDWYRAQVTALDQTEGDIDALSNRIAQIRTWTFVANRPDWLADPEHWQGVTRRVEDKLSDALHERLAARFVDRRTSVLMRRLRENGMLEAEVTATGDVTVEGQHVGMLQGFRFTPDPQAGGPEAKALNMAAVKALAGEIAARAGKLSLAGDEAFVLSNDGFVRWGGEPVARLAAGEKVLNPQIRLLADEHLSGPAREQVEARLTRWLQATVTRLLGPLQILEDAPDLTGIARGIAFQISEALGVLERARVAEEMKTLDQEGRAGLRKHGVRFGAFHLYLPLLLKPAPRTLAAQLWGLKHGGPDIRGLDDIAHLAASGRTSIPVDKETSKALYRAGGFRVCGERAVRVDILERLADLIRPAIAYRPGLTPGDAPPGAADQDGFVATGAMTSLVGCAGEDFAGILKSLGYVSSKRAGPAITVPLVPLAPTVPASAVAAQTLEDTVPAPEAALPSLAPTSLAPIADAGPAGTLELSAETVAEMATVSVDRPDTSPPEPDAIVTPAVGPAPLAGAQVLIDTAAPDAEAAAVLGAATSGVDPTRDPAYDPGQVAAQDAATGEAQDAIAADHVGDGAAEAVTPESATQTAEPVLIEVWRPHRHHGGRRPDAAAQRTDGRNRYRGTRAGAEPHANAESADGSTAGTEGPRSDPRRQHHRRPDSRPRPGHRPGSDSVPPVEPATGAPAGGDNRDGRHRSERFAQNRFRGNASREGGEQGHAGSGRPERGKREHRSREHFGREHGGKDQMDRNHAPRPRPERQPDPDSPFAKLLALKAQLEGRDKT